ncbi:MAG: hypothetical protein KDA91_23455 [Planctomycetaceae bacterium]|nr:hypothetical protein [Planctomycetaceae bacterium]
MATTQEAAGWHVQRTSVQGALLASRRGGTGGFCRVEKVDILNEINVCHWLYQCLRAATALAEPVAHRLLFPTRQRSEENSESLVSYSEWAAISASPEEKQCFTSVRRG